MNVDSREARSSLNFGLFEGVSFLLDVVGHGVVIAVVAKLTQDLVLETIKSAKEGVEEGLKELEEERKQKMEGVAGQN